MEVRLWPSLSPVSLKLLLTISERLPLTHLPGTVTQSVKTLGSVPEEPIGLTALDLEGLATAVAQATDWSSVYEGSDAGSLWVQRMPRLQFLQLRDLFSNLYVSRDVRNVKTTEFYHKLILIGFPLRISFWVNQGNAGVRG